MIMNTYRVDIDFKGAPAFSTTVLAQTEQAAKNAAIKTANACGCGGTVKHSKARLETEIERAEREAAFA